MTDLLTIKMMVEMRGVTHTIDEDLDVWKKQDPNIAHVITVRNWPQVETPRGMRDKFGYTEFVSSWIFNADGFLIGVGNYET